ncbi:INO80 complex subunit 4 [Hyphodiscus hymeniophilus]|uniref:INO80 complex subunit 4 n=1 Tax=Hyphodiscus hymeniophilus TaxID=353542 RepID=A0A9P6VE53_9HELO|nr:INO80 complex subunit 4 [Hyphodiscus hymeniophilus]
MASVAKPHAASAARRKSSKPSLVLKLKVPGKDLERITSDKPLVKEESPSKDSSSATSTTLPVAATSSNGDNPPASASNTPVASGTPIPTSSMPPPTEGPKKRGTKRGAAVALTPDGLPKPRGKPGPKKKARLEDGSIDHSATVPRAPNGTAHKLGPKANQGAINAGLRALDRTGKPCRKWQKGGFKVKSFTGVTWEIPRWKAPPKISVENKPAESSTSGDSSKENKDASQVESEKSNSGPEIEVVNSTAPSQLASSPAPSNPAIATTTGPAPAAPEPTLVVTATA